MLGASIYMSEDIEKNLSYIEKMHETGVKNIFTSLHIPEEDKKHTLENLKRITEKMNFYGMNLITDVSSSTFELYQIEKSEAQAFFKNLGIKSLRIDYGFSYEEIKKLSLDFHIVLNASTIDDEACQCLEAVGIDLSELTVCHNYYPREDTGLGRQFLYERNCYLKEKGFMIQAFIPGDLEKRGPIRAGLPTLEEHRTMDAVEAYLDLTKNFFVDEVLIGDISMSEKSLNRLKRYLEEGVITLLLSSVENNLPENFYSVHRNRKDVASHVVRSEESRIVLKEKEIKPENTNARPVGAVTLDNQLYGRYSGELQITKVDLPADERVNVLAHIEEKSIGLLSYIGPATPFEFLK